MYAAQQTSFGIMEFVWDLKNLGILSGNLGNLDWYTTLYPPYLVIPLTGNIGKNICNFKKSTLTCMWSVL